MQFADARLHQLTLACAGEQQWRRRSGRLELAHERESGFTLVFGAADVIGEDHHVGANSGVERAAA